MKCQIGGSVKAYIESRGITQAFLSKKTGIPQNILSERLNNKSELRAYELYLIGEALGVPLETFRQAD